MSEWEVVWETEEEDGESGTVTVASIYPPTLPVVPGPQPPCQPAPLKCGTPCFCTVLCPRQSPPHHTCHLVPTTALGVRGAVLDVPLLQAEPEDK